MFRKKVNELRKEINFYLKTNSEIKNISIGVIPDSLELFPDSKDEWVNLPDLANNKDCTSILYIGKKGGVFKEHKHTHSSEQLIIVNPTGKIRLITTLEDVIISYPNSYLIDKNIPHMVYFLETTELVIVWHPPFKKGWEAEEINEINK